MRILITILLMTISMVSHAGLGSDERFSLQEGDIVFQQSKSAQSSAIQAATGSRYTHVGLITMRKKTPYVLEAVNPVRIISFDKWKKRGVDSHVVVKRLKDDSVFRSRVNQRRMKSVARSHIGKKYDLLFAWDQKKMYCSELVFRIFFDGAGIHLGKVERFGDMNLSSPVVKSLVRKRVGKNLDVNEPIITPVSIMEDDQLKTVAEF